MEDTPLMIAIKNGQTNVVDLLMKIPTCDVNKRNTTGLSPLDMAIHRGYSHLIRILVQVRNKILSFKNKKYFLSIFFLICFVLYCAW